MGCGSSAQKEVVLIPQPQVCELHSGVYSFSAGEAFYTNLSGNERDDLAAVLASSPFRLTVSDDAKAAFHFEVVKSLPDLYDCTILISSHMLSEIELIADDLGILNHGRLLFEGSLDELRQSALRAGFAADNLEDMFLSMVEKDNAARKQRAQL